LPIQPRKKRKTKIEWLKKRRERKVLGYFFSCWNISNSHDQLVLYNSPKYINEIKTTPNISLPLRKNKPNSDALCFLLLPPTRRQTEGTL
jgi:hypothetical protein